MSEALQTGSGSGPGTRLNGYATDFGAAFNDQNTPATKANFWDVFRRLEWAIRRRAWLVGLLFALALGGAVVYLNYTPTIYRAVGKLIVAPRIANPGGETYIEGDSRFYATQTELLQGAKLNATVAGKMSKFRGPDMKLPDYALTVELPRYSQIFRVYVDSENAEFARVYVDMLFEEFIKFKGVLKTGLVGVALETFTREIGEKRNELKNAETELYEFMKTHPTAYLEGMNKATEKQMGDLNTQIRDKETQIELLKNLQDVFYKSQNASEAIDKFTVNRQAQGGNDKLFRELPWIETKRMLDNANADLANLKLRFKERHPLVQERTREINVLQTRLTQEADKARVQFAQDLQSMELTRKTLAEQLAKLTDENLKNVNIMTEYQKLQSNVERSRKLYDQLVSSLATISTSVDTSQMTIQVHEQAYVLGEPVAPKKMKTLLMWGGLGLAAGILLVILIDKVLNKVASPEQVETELGLDLIGVVPALSIRAKKPEDRLFSAHPDQQGFAECFRTLRSMLIQKRSNVKLQVLQITSPQPNDGKSFISANLALAMSQGGGNVLLIGADMRRGDVHQAFGLSNDSGLSEVLQGTCDWRSQIRATAFENLHVLSCGKPPTDAARLIQGPVMKNLLNEARKHYDWIIVDCPPLVAVSDAILLAPNCDGTLLALRSESTPCRVALIALDVLSRRVKPPVGAVLNALDLRSGYYPSYGYYRYQSAHYTYGYDSNVGSGGRRGKATPPKEQPPLAS